MTSHQFELSESPQDAISAVKFASSSPKLLVASWDKHVYLYDASEGDSARILQKYEHRAPVLDLCFGKDDQEAFTVGVDWDVRRVDLTTGEQTVLSSHDAGANAVVYDPAHDMVISGGWDSTLHIHLRSQPDHVPNTIQLPSKAFSISLTATKVVVAMATRAVHIYELDALATAAAQSSQPSPNLLEVEPWQTRESSLKFMTRAVSCMSNDAGYASSSIEGRVAVEWFDPSSESQARKYAFKCHRQTVDSVDVVYPVNALSFHPKHGTFASGGGDGVVALWDGVAKRRIRQYQKYPASIAALDFSKDGRYLAVAVSSGFEDGQEDIEGSVVKVFIRELSDSEAKGKVLK
ncbi:nuclear pore complex subunit [Pseudovirgaria hyperparasitica]|uniref:Nuclear pore complex subunit n=1 Tax=Pseudovirgaria hyperparasitica TaxID=470096 RepID=A0A6A6VSI6_9PEZI|nr:nuclear pore complex subunit [Pseudovirgaria hyperparasitica]KAF2752560.1 nuclear pore complex subunit [Pseudovirgaria hyperparasitica]